MMDWVNWLVLAVVVILVVLLLVDAVLVEIPWVRKYRGLLGGLIVFGGGVVVGRGVSGDRAEDPSGTPPDSPVDVAPEPETFDDEPERKTDAEADDLDLETAAAGRTLDELADSNDSNRAALDDLLRAAGKGVEAGDVGAGERGSSGEANDGSDAT